MAEETELNANVSKFVEPEEEIISTAETQLCCWWHKNGDEDALKILAVMRLNTNALSAIKDAHVSLMGTHHLTVEKELPRKVFSWGLIDFFQRRSLDYSWLGALINSIPPDVLNVIKYEHDVQEFLALFSKLINSYIEGGQKEAIKSVNDAYKTLTMLSFIKKENTKNSLKLHELGNIISENDFEISMRTKKCHMMCAACAEEQKKEDAAIQQILYYKEQTKKKLKSIKKFKESHVEECEELKKRVQQAKKAFKKKISAYNIICTALENGIDNLDYLFKASNDKLEEMQHLIKSQESIEDKKIKQVELDNNLKQKESK